MVSPISPVPAAVKTSIFYVNDIHGQITKMERIKTASDVFDSFTYQDKTDKLKLSSGDTFLGEDLKLNLAAAKFLDVTGIEATAVGNHECDIPPEDLIRLTSNSRFKLLGLNANIPEDNSWNKKVIKSYIQEKNGNQYGIIGLVPTDIFLRIKNKERFDGITVDQMPQVLKELQEEVDKLKSMGINKIILLSHTGYENEKQIAEEISGIDVILGGHSHDLIKGVEERKNLFYSKDTGEPIVITQAGKDGNNFGVLNLEFNEKGVITKVQNNVGETKDFPKNVPLKYLFDTILGKSEKIGEVGKAYKGDFNRLAQENPNASFIADALRHELKTDIALINASNLRNQFETGPLYTRDVSSITPFKNKMTIVQINEKELVDALKFGAKSLTKPDNKPGIVQLSGLKYKINKAGELLEAKYTADGKEILIDINNPNTAKIYTAAMDDFYSKGGDGFSMLNKYDNAISIFDVDKDKYAIDYIKKINKPLDILPDGRIQIVN